ncbi:MAG: hypothetical protein JW704_02275 [Anaerolineaceae bacterium]|nr:hypothetical protein [Anaerolineaceae bacterium]
MQHKTNPVARVFAILFTVLFVITAMTALVVYNIFNQAFDSEIYKQSINRAGIYDHLTDLLGEQLVFQLSHNTCLQNPTSCTEEQQKTAPAYLANVDASEWSTVFSYVIDETWLKTELESVIDQFFTFLNHPGQPLMLNISLLELKSRLGGEDGYQAFRSLLNSLEPCTTGDLLNLTKSALENANLSRIQLCRPDASVMIFGESAIRGMLKATADNLPDDTSELIKPPSGHVGDSLVVAQKTIRILRLAALISPGIPLVFLLIISLLVVRNFKSLFIWWGIPLTVTGALTALSALLASQILNSLLLDSIDTVGLAPGLLKTIRSIFMEIVASFRDALLIQSGIVFALGLAMLFLYLLIKSRGKPIVTE